MFLLGAAANQWIFAGEDKYLRNQWTYGARQLLGVNSVSMLNGAEHRQRRRLLAPHFSHGAMRAFVPQISAITERHLASWAETPSILTVWPVMRQLAFEIAVAFIFSETDIDVPYLSQQFKVWTDGLFTPLPLNLPGTTFSRALRAKRALTRYLADKVAARQALATQPDDILGSLITTRDEHGQPLLRATIIDEIQVQLFAGHDTTVTATSNLMLLLAQHPAVLRKARDEQRGHEDEPLTLESLKSFPYLHYTISEGLRCIPPIGGAFRVTTEDTEFGGYRIPAGWTVAFSPRETHRGPNWHQPEEFDPDRWSPERAENKQLACSFVAFGGGPRMCLGQHFAMVEMSVIMALLLRRYHWQLVPQQDLDYVFIPFPRPKSNLQVRFTRRLSAQ